MNKSRRILRQSGSRLFLGLFGAYFFASCGGSDSEFLNLPSETEPSAGYLYVASGSCYGGGATTSTGTGTIARYRLDTGAFDKVVIDYSSLSPADLPAGVVEYDSNTLAVLVENASGRRIDLVRKSDGLATPFYVNATTLSAQLRGLSKTADGSLLISKSTAIEKVTTIKARVLNGANPFIFTPAAPCATATTVFTAQIELPGGKFLFAHAAATPNNIIGMIKSGGYTGVASDCVRGQAAPNTTALPTALIQLRYTPNRLLVAYGSSTTLSNLLYSYDIDEVAGTFATPTLAYINTSVINGPSAMVEDSNTGLIYVANALNSAETIEKFSYVTHGRTLNREGSGSFIGRSAYTKCVSALVVGQ